MEDRLYNAFRANSSDSLPAYAELTEKHRSLSDIVLQRKALADAVHSDDIFSPVNRAAGDYQDSGLRLYLLLTCLEPIGEAVGERYLTFQTWLETTKDGAPAARTEAATEFLETCDSSVTTVDDAVKLTLTLHKAYCAEHGFRTKFRTFFTRCLSLDLQDQIVSDCWVYREKHLTNWGALHAVTSSYDNTSSPQLARLTIARRRWDALDTSDRIRELSNALETIRNKYTHCLTLHFGANDKDPAFRFKGLRQAADALHAGRLIALPDAAFESEALKHGRQGFNNVSISVSSEKCVVRLSELEGQDQQMWLASLIGSASMQFDRGDTVWMRDANLAIATSELPLSHHLGHWIHHALTRIIQGEVQAQST